MPSSPAATTDSPGQRATAAPAGSGPSAVVALAIAVGVGLAVGALTAYGQGWLGDATGSLANSAGPWSLAAFVVARHARRVPVAIPAAVLTLVASEAGYVIANELRDVPSATSTIVFWVTAGLLAGPPLGVAASWSTEADLRRPIGWGVVAGVLVGEGTYGWTTIADTTDWRYWAVEAAIGVALAGVVAAIELGRGRWRGALAAPATAAAAATVVFAAARLG